MLPYYFVHPRRQGSHVCFTRKQAQRVRWYVHNDDCSCLTPAISGFGVRLQVFTFYSWHLLTMDLKLFNLTMPQFPAKCGGAHVELREPPTSASQVLGFQVCTTTPGDNSVLEFSLAPFPLSSECQCCVPYDHSTLISFRASILC